MEANRWTFIGSAAMALAAVPAPDSLPLALPPLVALAGFFVVLGGTLRTRWSIPESPHFPTDSPSKSHHSVTATQGTTTYASHSPIAPSGSTTIFAPNAGTLTAGFVDSRAQHGIRADNVGSIHVDEINHQPPEERDD